MANEFIHTLTTDLVNKKKITESSANVYIRILFNLNNREPIKNLSFLLKKDTIMSKVNEYAETTQKTIFAALVSVLSLFQDKPVYKGLHRFYQEKMIEKMKTVRDETTGEKTEKQKNNWIEWKDVKELCDKMYDETKEFSNKKTLTPKESDLLLHTVVLALYTFIPPRRNQDYLNMVLVKKWNSSMPTEYNYLDMSDEKFIFNKYKTAKKYGIQTLDIPDDLMDILVAYLRHHSKTGPFLVQNDKPLTAGNAITRILNKIFGKKVGSSMLRHIFLTDKYGDLKEEQQTLASAMGHSVHEQQNVYVKT